MIILTYIIRIILMLQFVYAGVEKLFLPFDADKFAKENTGMETFIRFYTLLNDTGYLYFVGLFELLCGILLIFNKTYLLAAVMMIPLLLCIVTTHLLISHSPFRLAYDSFLLLMNAMLLFRHYKALNRFFLHNMLSH